MYKVILSRKAEKNFAKLTKSQQKKISKKLDVLEKNPWVGKKLGGELSNFYSWRAWPYRIIYQIFKKQLIVTVLKIEHRQGVYK